MCVCVCVCVCVSEGGGGETGVKYDTSQLFDQTSVLDIPLDEGSPLVV